MQNQVERLLGLLVVIIVGVGGLLLLLRLSGRGGGQRDELLLGYPPDRFPARDLTRSGQLEALAQIQARLALIYSQLPPHSDLRIWLRAFLNELREIMDTAYRVVLITHVYGQPAPLDRLIREVQEIETQVAEQLARRLLARDGDTQQELLDGRLATLRMCTRELASLASMGAAVPLRPAD